jgi:GTPase SAR1 family protein
LVEEYTFRTLLGKKVLITGDVGVGKTKLTLTLLKEALNSSFNDRITIIDMAPVLTEVNDLSVGGKLLAISQEFGNVRYLTVQRVETPRLSAKSANELLYLVSLNEKRIRPLITQYLKHPSPILFVNDISIYLQSGNYTPILTALTMAKTFIANGYSGQTFSSDFGTQVSNIERRLMKKLSNTVDLVINL